MYIAHESEIPKPGDFVTRPIGRQPVVVVRGVDGMCRLLTNRCTHRGALICEVERGNQSHFRCFYHGWTYDNTGKLVHIPKDDAYPADFDRDELADAGSARGKLPRLHLRQRQPERSSVARLPRLGGGKDRLHDRRLADGRVVPRCRYAQDDLPRELEIRRHGRLPSAGRPPVGVRNLPAHAAVRTRTSTRRSPRLHARR